jgi:hypothetical protein
VRRPPTRCWTRRWRVWIRRRPSFKGLTADIRKISHTDVVNVDDVDSGTIHGEARQAARYPHPHRFDQPPADCDHRRRQSPAIYPQTNEAQEVDLGKNRGVVDQFMLLGFGSNSGEIRNAYTVTLGGADSINGEKTTRILLVPKDPEVLARVKKCELWISDKGWTVQQKFHTGVATTCFRRTPV